MKLNYKALLFVLLFAVKSYAQNRVGNGGDVVTCKDKSPQVLDLYESSAEIITPAETDYQKIVSERLDLLAEAQGKLADQYRIKFSGFLNDSEFKATAKLTDIKDSEHLVLPKGCRLKQAAIRKNATAKNEKLFLFDNDNWQEMDSLNKAALIMHEIIYDHFYKLGERNSIKARKVNALLFSKNFSKKQFWELIQDLKIPIYP
ncbi:hypothetical protein [Pseudobdellovibrio sp. HCB154]|uniref:hypothetical protein n=1 Tax=Pseudobdellovibrio sp. HCB154 TaxID=3386277 RepID=UPI00391732C4